MAFCAKNGDSDLEFFCGYLYLTFTTAVSYEGGVHHTMIRFSENFSFWKEFNVASDDKIIICPLALSRTLALPSDA